MSGIPSPDYKAISLATIAVNTCAALMVFDLTFSARLFYTSKDLSFARVGYVSDTNARILVREPVVEHHPVSLRYWKSGRPAYDYNAVVVNASLQSYLVSPDENTDFTAVFDAGSLLPDTRYEYMVSNNKSGAFITAPAPGHTSKSAGNSFTFLHSSCTVPNFPYAPFRHKLSNPGFKHLAKVLPALKAQFMVFLGDFIYIDIPHRFGIDKESYRREYRWVYASPDWPSVTNQKGSELPWIHVYDDHEISNDWDKNETGVYTSAADAWNHYQVSVNPPPMRSNVSYFSFIQGPASFFLMDTRRYRTPFDKTNGTWEGTNSTKSMLGSQQRQDLIDWLKRKEPAGVKWKVVVSSIPFTKNWRWQSEDTWAGYLGERQVLLEAMWDASRDDEVGVVVLSGDRHEFAATAFPPPTTGPNANRWPSTATVHEFSASPMSMFYLPIRTYRQDDDEDVCLKYLPDGNSKFGALKITSPPTSDQSTLHYSLYVDGEEAWRYTITTPTSNAALKKDAPFLWLRETVKSQKILSRSR